MNKEYNFRGAFDHYRVSVSFTSLNLTINKLKVGFSKKNQAIFCALTDVVMSCNSSQESLLAVGELFTIDFERLSIEHDLFVSFRVNYPNTKLDFSSDVLKCIQDNSQFNFCCIRGNLLSFLASYQLLPLLLNGNLVLFED